QVLKGIVFIPGPERGRTESAESPVVPWRHLVARHHPWRKQLYLKGRNMTVRQLLGTLKANRQSPEEAAANLDLPLEAIHEAVTYAEQNQELLRIEAEIERLFLLQRGYRGAAPAVSG